MAKDRSWVTGAGKHKRTVSAWHKSRSRKPRHERDEGADANKDFVARFRAERERERELDAELQAQAGRNVRPDREVT